MTTRSTVKSALTVAGLDPSGGAGIAADLKVFRRLDIHGMAVATSLTAQNSIGVAGVYAVSAGVFERQLTVLFDDVIPDAAKTGVLCNAELVEILALTIKKYKVQNLVVDPVAVSSSGKEMLDMQAVAMIKKELLPLTRVFTPNIYEASLFSGMQIDSEPAITEAAKILHDMGCETVVITGGHLTRRASDTYYDGAESIKLESRLYDGSYHGTGCVLSAAIAGGLALGQSCLSSLQNAKSLIESAIKTSYRIGKGMEMLHV